VDGAGSNGKPSKLDKVIIAEVFQAWFYFLLDLELGQLLSSSVATISGRESFK